MESMIEEIHNTEDECELESAHRYFTKNNLEFKEPMCFFYSMNKKIKSRVQFQKEKEGEVKHSQ